MPTLRRLGTLFVCLSLVVVSGVASAAPLRESAPVSFGKAIATAYRAGKEDYQERRQVAGPGLFKRTAVKLGENLRTAGSNVGAMGMGVASASKAAALNTGARLVAGKEATVSATGSFFSSAKQMFTRSIAAIASAPRKLVTAVKTKVAVIKERRALNKEIKTWMGQKELAAVKTYNKGARAENRVGTDRTLKYMNLVGAAANAVIPTPMNHGMAVVGLAAAASASREQKKGERAALTSTLNHAVRLGHTPNRILVARLAAAGMINTDGLGKAIKIKVKATN